MNEAASLPALFSAAAATQGPCAPKAQLRRAPCVGAPPPSTGLCCSASVQDAALGEAGASPANTRPHSPRPASFPSNSADQLNASSGVSSPRLGANNPLPPKQDLLQSQSYFAVPAPSGAASLQHPPSLSGSQAQQPAILLQCPFPAPEGQRKTVAFGPDPSFIIPQRYIFSPQNSQSTLASSLALSHLQQQQLGQPGSGSAPLGPPGGALGLSNYAPTPRYTFLPRGQQQQIYLGFSNQVSQVPGNLPTSPASTLSTSSPRLPAQNFYASAGRALDSPVVSPVFSCANFRDASLVFKGQLTPYPGLVKAFERVCELAQEEIAAAQGRREIPQAAKRIDPMAS